MQELMSRHKGTGSSPRDCLKRALQQRWTKPCPGKLNHSISDRNQIKNVPDPRPLPKTRRKRKSNPTNAVGNIVQPNAKDGPATAPSTPTKKRSSNTSVSSQNSTPTMNNLPGVCRNRKSMNFMEN